MTPPTMTQPAASVRTTQLRIGCAGWSISSAHRDRFLDGPSALARYATRFDAVEINSSFYRPHQQKTYVRWAASVPENFLFSVKLPQAITHTSRLVDTGPLLDAFIDQASGLGSKLGCLLAQFPPSLHYDRQVAADFFELLRQRWPGGIACEPRHPSWFGTELDAFWRDRGITRVGADPSPCPGGERSAGTSTLRYWRLHGSPRTYYSGYDDAALLCASSRVIADTPGEATAWVIFDNTAAGHAIPDAFRFGELVKSHR